MYKKDFIVCVDSDGCAIDSMNIKHFRCFGPAFVKIWKLDNREEEMLSRWNEINLFSSTRGINRFKGLALILEELEIESEEDTKEFVEWTKNAKELSNSSLEILTENESKLVFLKALKWSYEVNKLIAELPMSSAFAHVEETFNHIKKQAEIAVVSSANKEAIVSEWEHNHLLEKVDSVFSQNEGTKKDCIELMTQKEIGKNQILMVGDAPGDWEAASANGVWFYPILAGKENESWNELNKVYLDLFFKGQFDKELQTKLLQKMNNNLGM